MAQAPRVERFAPVIAAKVRLWVGDALAEGVPVDVEGRAAHYLRHVMRLAAGDAVRLFNGRDGEWRAEIEAVQRDRCRLRPVRQDRAQTSEPGPILVFSPIKKDRMDVLVEKAVELGAERLLPVLVRNTTVARVNDERLRLQVVEAAEQCGRLTLPEVEAARLLAVALGAWPQDRPLLFLDERPGGRPVAEVCGALAEGPPPGVLVGPEGGFDEEEAASLRSAGFVVRTTLGPRILRSETAALAALACWQAFAGDWRAAAGRAPTTG